MFCQSCGSRISGTFCNKCDAASASVTNTPRTPDQQADYVLRVSNRIGWKLWKLCWKVGYRVVLGLVVIFLLAVVVLYLAVPRSQPSYGGYHPHGTPVPSDVTADSRPSPDRESPTDGPSVSPSTSSASEVSPAPSDVSHGGNDIRVGTSNPAQSDNPLAALGAHTSADDINRVYSIGNGIASPSVISKVDPEYSEEARAAKYSGSVTLSLVVNPDGTPGEIEVVNSLGMGLDEKAIEAVSKWRFRPGMYDGVPVKVRTQIEVTFRLL